MSERYPLDALQRARLAERERAQREVAAALERIARARESVHACDERLREHEHAAPRLEAATLRGAALQRAAAFSLRHADRARELRGAAVAARAALEAAFGELGAARRALEHAAGAERAVERDRERFDRQAARARERREQHELEERQQALCAQGPQRS